MAASRKKAVVRRFLPGTLWGYLPANGLLVEEGAGQLGLLDLHGKVQAVPLGDVKYVCYVRDFNTADAANPERLLRKTFSSRPRGEGLWVRLLLRDGDVLEGLAALDTAFADGWAAEKGVFLTPPDVRGNTQRMYVPRPAISAMEVLAVVTTSVRRKSATAPATREDQPELFAPTGDEAPRIN